MNRNRKLFGVFLLLALFTASAVAQVATADLHVTAKDAKGAVVKDATITLRNVAQGFERSQTVNIEGEYQFRALPPGRYEVTITAPGFAKTIVKDVTVTVGQLAELPVSLQVAAVTETVNVTSEAELVETQRSSSATTIDETRIDNLPINGRNYINFALTDSKLARDTAPSIGAAPTSGLNSGGQRARGNQVNVDGMDAVDNSTNGIRSTVSQEAVQEFQLLTNGYDAEYGRASGAIINIITKGGTNDIHGSAFGYLRNRYIQATNPFSNVEQPGYTRAQGGFTLGGPLKKDKTYYFLSFETTRRHETGFSSIGGSNKDFGLSATADLAPFVQASGFALPPGFTIPVKVTPQQAAFMGQFPLPVLQAMLGSGNPALVAQAKGVISYSLLAGSAGSVALNKINPLTTLLGIGGGFFAPSVATGSAPGFQIDPLPASYVGLNTLIGNFPIQEATDIYSLRLDHRLTNNQNLLFRASISPSDVDGIQVNAQGPQNFGQNAYSRTSQQNFHDLGLTATDTLTIGNNRINELRFQYARRSLLYNYSNSPDGSKVAVNIPGTAFFGREPFSFVKRKEQRYQFTDHFSWTKGKHSMKFGADVNYLPLVADFTVNFGGIYNFGDLNLGGGTPTLSAVQAYGAGLPQNFIQGVGNPHDQFSNTAIAGFIQDSWRLSHNLTLNYGVRYDVELTPVFAATTAAAQQAQDALGITQGIPRDYNNFAPRVGLAWDPKGDGKTVIRGSYGIFYDHPLLALAFDSDVADASQAPQIVLFGGTPTGCSLNAANTFTGRFGNCPLATPLNFLGQDQRFNPTPNAPTAWANQAFLTAGPGGTPIPLPFLPFGFPTAKNFVYPYSNQATFAIERDLGHDFSINVQYNFVGGRHLNRPINANPVRTDLLVQNWKNAVAAGDPGAASGPLFVGTVGSTPCGANWISPAFVSFFRPSGMNPSLAPLIAGSPCQAVANGLLAANGLGLGVSVPFSDMPANYSNGSSVYHGMSVNIKKRMSHHYEMLASYTWSHAIDDSTDLESPLSPQDNYHPALERSNSLFDQRQRFVLSGVYQSGKQGAGFTGGLLSDWTLAPIIEFGSGRPFNIVTGVDNNFDFGTTTDRPSTASGPGITNSCGFTSVFSKYSPTGYLIAPCWMDGQFTGNLGRNAGLKPRTVFTDLRVARRLNITERLKMDAIMDVFNLANRFNVADVNPPWDQAGKPTAAFDPRQFQFALKVSW